MDLAYIGYLLLVFPGFCLVWTFRHFNKSEKIGEFEYAAWSFLWGVVQFAILGLALLLTKNSGPVLDFNNPGILLGTLMGSGLAIAIGSAFPMGFMGAAIAKTGFFLRLDKKLFSLLHLISRLISF